MNKRQLQIYEYIKHYISEKNYSPSIREIATAVGYSSGSCVHGHLDVMREKGYINFIDTRPRTLQIVR